jgi:hypothetical protein
MHGKTEKKTKSNEQQQSSPKTFVSHKNHSPETNSHRSTNVDQASTQSIFRFHNDFKSHGQALNEIKQPLVNNQTAIITQQFQNSKFLSQPLNDPRQGFRQQPPPMKV